MRGVRAVSVAFFVLPALAGAGLLVADYARRTAQSRERHRWANLRGWRFVESDPLLPDRWRHGVITQGGAGEARDLVSGRLFTAGGPRPVHVFDHVQSGKVTTVIVAVQRLSLIHISEPTRPY